MKLEAAEKYAIRVTEAISSLCDQTLIVGSIRRRRPEVNDIDIVVIPGAWYWNSIPSYLKQSLSLRFIEGGLDLFRMTFPIDLQVDIYRASPKTWGVLTLIRTGSTQHNIKLCSWAKSMGLMLSAKDGVIKDGQVIASRTEEDIFKALCLDYVPPELREER